jgi:hypothetical protein
VRRAAQLHRAQQFAAQDLKRPFRAGFACGACDAAAHTAVDENRDPAPDLFYNGGQGIQCGNATVELPAAVVGND